MSVEALARLCPAGFATTLKELRQRLRCDKCGGSDFLVDLGTNAPRAFREFVCISPGEGDPRERIRSGDAGG